MSRYRTVPKRNWKIAKIEEEDGRFVIRVGERILDSGYNKAHAMRLAMALGCTHATGKGTYWGDRIKRLGDSYNA